MFRKRWVRLCLWIGVPLLAVPLILYGILGTSKVQTYLSSRLTRYLSKELNASVSVASVDISWFFDITLKEVLVLDRQHDTLCYLREVVLDLEKLEYRQRRLLIHKLTLLEPRVRLSREPGLDTWNYQFLIDYFTDTDTSKTTDKLPWKAEVKEIEIREAQLLYTNRQKRPLQASIDYNYFVINNINLVAKEIKLGDNLTARIDRLNCIERSGFQLRKMTADIALLPGQVVFKNLKINTPFSALETDLSFSFSQVSDFSDFVNQVKMKAYFLPSDLDTRDLVFFAPGLAGMENRLVLGGEVEGKVNNLKLKDFTLEFGTFSRFRGDIRFTGLPYIDETYMQLSIKDCKTNHYDLNTLRINGKTLVVPEEIAKLGNIVIRGNFTGFINDFVSYASFQTSIGNVSTDLALRSDSSGNLRYSGKIRTREFNLGLLTGQQRILGKLNLVATVEGAGFKPESMVLKIEGVIDSLYFNQNRFNEIRLAGNYVRQKFTGDFKVIDPRLQLDFSGSVDLSGPQPLLDFDCSVKHAGLNQLNLVNSDSIMAVSTDISAHLRGLQPDSITGTLELLNTRFRMNNSNYLMDSLLLSIFPVTGPIRSISLNSDFVDASVSGDLNTRHLVTSFKQLLFRYFPSLFPEPAAKEAFRQPQFVYEVSLKNTRPFTRMFLPKASLADNATLEGVYNPAAGLFKLDFQADSADVLGNHFSTIAVLASANDDHFALETRCEQIAFSDQLGVENLVFETKGNKDSIHFQLKWQDENPVLTNTGDLAGYVNILSPKHFRFHLNQSNTIINDSLWSIHDENTLDVDGQRIRISKLVFASGDEKITIDGAITPDPLDKMSVHFEGFDLSNIDFLTVPAGLNLDGYVSGQLDLKNLYATPDILSDITIDAFAINQDMLGKADIKTRWDPRTKALQASLDVIYKGNKGENKPISVQGYYYPQHTDSSLDFTAHVENFKLRTISNFLSSFSSKFNGLATGDLRLKGSLRYPALSGIVNVLRGELLIDYLNTEYYFNHEFIFEKDKISLDGIQAMDSQGNKAMINGAVWHNYFRDFRIDLHVKPINLLVLNTNASDNEVFYGKAFATGDMSIQGPANKLKLDIRAKTDKGTQLYLPINTTAELTANEFIQFTTAVDTSQPARNFVPEFSGVSLKFDLEATRDAGIKIFMPYEMGNIRATGEGKLKMDVNTSGEFNIYGDYQIDEGQFQFTLQNVVNRLFEIQQGGLIHFAGDPYATQINIRAVHKLDVPLTGLRVSPDQASTLSKKIPIDCIIDLSGSLFNPEMNFIISTPEKDPEINRILFSQLDTNNQQQMSEQMIFLLVLKQFKPLERNNPLDLNASMGSSSWDILSSQLNSWLSHISNDFDVGVNYKPGDRLTSDEITVAMSTQLFDDRVSVDGNFGYAAADKAPAATGQNASNLVGDVKVEVKLTRDGQLRVKAYNKSNNMTLFENNSPYTQGVGIFFRKEFDTLSELFSPKKKRTSEIQVKERE